MTSNKRLSAVAGLMLAVAGYLCLANAAFAYYKLAAAPNSPELYAACGSAGGDFHFNGPEYWCESPNGTWVSCTNTQDPPAPTCYGGTTEEEGAQVRPPRTFGFATVALHAGDRFNLDKSLALTLCPGMDTGHRCGIPCDPFLCQIFCGGKPYCDVSVIRVHAKLDPEPNNLAGTFSSPGTGQPAGVPVLQ